VIDVVDRKRAARQIARQQVEQKTRRLNSAGFHSGSEVGRKTNHDAPRPVRPERSSAPMVSPNRPGRTRHDPQAKYVDALSFRRCRDAAMREGRLLPSDPGIL